VEVFRYMSTDREFKGVTREGEMRVFDKFVVCVGSCADRRKREQEFCRSFVGRV
jgi:hypothetical protein